jgi:predicted ATPase
MIEKLEIKGFKCFDNEKFDVTPLTLLSGLNSSGKSTFLQAIRLVCGYKNPLSGHGPLPELVSTHHKDFKISMIASGEEYVFEYPKANKSDGKYDVPILTSYISAARLGPELHLPISEGDESSENVGEKGEYVLDFLQRHNELGGLPEILKQPEAKSNTVEKNVSAWLSIISPGISFKWEPMQKADLIRAEYSDHRPSNVGFGVSYTLPIIANVLGYAAMVAKGEQRSPLLLIENPEAHLHPAGQTQIGQFLARAASCGVQVIVETHSDHLLNGIRLAVKDEILESQDTTFYYFHYDFKEEERTFVQQPVIDEDGFFDEWPDGFFDETEKNLERIL